MQAYPSLRHFIRLYLFAPYLMGIVLGRIIGNPLAHNVVGAHATDICRQQHPDLIERCQDLQQNGYMNAIQPLAYYCAKVVADVPRIYFSAPGTSMGFTLRFVSALSNREILCGFTILVTFAYIIGYTVSFLFPYEKCSLICVCFGLCMGSTFGGVAMNGKKPRYALVITPVVITPRMPHIPKDFARIEENAVQQHGDMI
ncbi:hypothetical protein AURANDRAFT_67311 [Aureococcus anophagefferens]|uniref:Uncharacterized protein n=1 Tax=Aureococcus anophagefferens TaxID=44056 RepID=F0YKQ6_AURAN|nr:hypothetical protein AURANDRAFT_67311 [Aureococcus anophagefferens]EGB04319.1 hypothetical protein AURANDRAFT_67311 [Aureococcus anophagefferens]|eukprot:XP_009041029.1 hypothetical protein AURANDRAFT_67311 [Aureococcus anophagefferens]